MEKINIGNTVIKFDIIRTNRKSVGLHVDPKKGVIIRVPEKLDKESIKEIIRNKSSWLLEKLDRVNEIKPEPTPKEFMSGEKLLYLGKRYRLKVMPQPNEKLKQVNIKLYQGKFIVNIPYRLDKQKDKRLTTIRKELISWYRKHAEQKINERVNKYKEYIDVKPNTVKIKKQEKRWGSCSSKGNLNFNWKIIMAPMSIIDYVVVHELTHLKYPNHSNEFWQLVETILHDYKNKREWLRINGPILDF